MCNLKPIDNAPIHLRYIDADLKTLLYVIILIKIIP